ncbi:MAG: hypothetical protein KMY53_15685 [Desulfarculus sp.]|nr:hypothetical protein [Pseudomonadota bacterium]MBV1718341.1 hypothetical protein [Desulfarculus sp.]MBU4576898.1 hypothetical protein [Pseudomonadota bacterium]MBU4596312.1 hypothetical protein [Pseudomonadota bacterium]MBV1739609.1 hypothetical protein [Desulfarculus sp.]
MQSKMIAYDPLTGEIRGVCLTPPQVLAWQAQGLTAIDGPEEAGLDTHRVAEGQVVAKVQVELSPDQSQIVADGQDQAVVAVTVSGQEPPGSLELTPWAARARAWPWWAGWAPSAPSAPSPPARCWWPWPIPSPTGASRSA